MRSNRLRHVIDRLRQALPGGKSGSTMLWAIGALVVLSVAGATVALMSPAALQSKLEQEAGMRAYYNANAGLNYILGMQQAAQVAGTNFSNFTSNLGGGNVVAYSVGSNGSFSYQIGNIISNGTNGTYQITNLIGTLNSGSATGSHSYVIYGGGKGNSGVQQYSVSGSKTNSPGDFVNFSTGTINLTTTGTVYGDVFGNTVNLNGGSYVYGSIKQSSTSTQLYLQGKYLGGSGEQICSNSSVYIDGDVTIEGTIYSKGAVNINNGDVIGDVYANGDVTLNSGSTVKGNIYALGAVNISNGTVYGNVYATKTVTLDSGSRVRAYGPYSGDINTQTNVKINNGYVDGYVHYLTGFQMCSYCTVKGSDKNPAYPSYSFDCDMSATLPSHKTKSSSTAFVLDWSAPYSGYRTITAKSSLDDYYAYTSFTTAGGTNLCFDLSNGGYITIFVSGSFNVNSNNLYVRTSASTSCFDSGNLLSKSNTAMAAFASRVYIDSSGTGEMTFNSGGSWFGTIFANGNITLPNGGSSALIGAYYSTGGTISSMGSAYVKYVESDYVKYKW